MLRVVCIAELMDCNCEAGVARPLVWVPDEDKPRCFECLKPVQQTSRLSVIERWHVLVINIFDATGHYNNNPFVA